MKIPFTVLLVFAFVPASSLAVTPADTSPLERDKAKVVSRLYQATYGSAERCKKAPPDTAAEYQKELTRFVEANPRLMRQVVQSPYYDRARQKFSKHEAVDPVRDTPEKLAGECKHLANILRSMTDTPEGKKAVEKYEATLSN